MMTIHSGALSMVFLIIVGPSVGLSAEPPSKPSVGQNRKIPRLTLTQFRDQLFNEPESVLDRPLLIKNVLSEQECENVCDLIFEGASGMPIVAQRTRIDESQIDEISPLSTTITTITDMYDCTFDEAIDWAMRSSPTDAFFAFVEGLLDGDEQRLSESQKNKHLHNARDFLSRVRESLFAPFGKAMRTDDYSTNWFDLFPSQAAPTDCVIVAGQGAMSTFHRDPLEWTGTSICLEGRKIWRFLPPISKTEPPDNQLKSYRLLSTAWDRNDCDGDDYTREPKALSAGWQSNFALFPTMPQRLIWDDDVHKKHPGSIPARDLAELEGSDRIVEDLAASATLMPPFLPDGFCTHQSGSNEPDFVSVVQRPGDMLLIPAYWYHQTYAPEPSIAVASQRCGRWEAHRVVKHVVALQNDLSPDALPELLTRNSYTGSGLGPNQVVEELFRVLKHYWGSEE